MRCQNSQWSVLPSLCMVEWMEHLSQIESDGNQRTPPARQKQLYTCTMPSCGALQQQTCQWCIVVVAALMSQKMRQVLIIVLICQEKQVSFLQSFIVHPFKCYFATLIQNFIEEFWAMINISISFNNDNIPLKNNIPLVCTLFFSICYSMQGISQNNLSVSVGYQPV